MRAKEGSGLRRRITATKRTVDDVRWRSGAGRYRMAQAVAAPWIIQMPPGTRALVLVEHRVRVAWSRGGGGWVGGTDRGRSVVRLDGGVNERWLLAVACIHQRLVRRHWREVVVKVLCSCVPAYGHYLPMVGVARALQDAGHDVTFVTGAGFDVPAGDGFSLRVAGEDTVTPAMRAIAAAPQFPTWSPAEQRTFIVRHVFAGERLTTGFDDQLAAAHDIDPDAIVHDPMELAAPLIAALLGRGEHLRRLWARLPTRAASSRRRRRRRPVASLWDRNPARRRHPWEPLSRPVPAVAR
jgi:hypothetical protein